MLAPVVACTITLCDVSTAAARTLSTTTAVLTDVLLVVYRTVAEGAAVTLAALHALVACTTLRERSQLLALPAQRTDTALGAETAFVQGLYCCITLKAQVIEFEFLTDDEAHATSCAAHLAYVDPHD
jgi:hypothetical protein